MRDAVGVSDRGALPEAGMRDAVWVGGKGGWGPMEGKGGRGGGVGMGEKIEGERGGRRESRVSGSEWRDGWVARGWMRRAVGARRTWGDWDPGALPQAGMRDAVGVLGSWASPPGWDEGCRLACRD